MSVNIDVVDSSRRDNGFLVDERRLHPHAISCHDVASLVNGVLRRAGTESIARLRIFGHGHDGLQAVGGGTRPSAVQYIAIDNSGELMNRTTLSLLCGHFAAGAIVQLFGCRVARAYGELLLWELARLWQVRVQASNVRHDADPHDRFGSGHIREANADPTLWNSSPFASSGQGR